MRMQIFKRNGTFRISCFLAFSIVPLQMLSHTRLSIPFSNYIIYIVYLAILFFYYIKNTEIGISKSVRFLYYSVIVGMLFIPIFVFHVKSVADMIYLFLSICFLATCDILGRQLSKDNYRIIFVWVILCTAIVDFMVILNINEINVNTISGVFYSANDKLRYRASFGFWHPNFAAIVLDTLLLLYYILLNYIVDVKLKRIIVFCILINCVPLLCTGSRTAIMSAIAFICFEIGFRILKKIRSKKIRGLIAVSLVFIISFIMLNINYDYESLSKFSSGRLSAVSVGLESLGRNNSLIFGFTVSKVSNLNASLSGIDATGSDNWYYTYIARFGIVGMVFFLLPLIIMIYRIYSALMKNLCMSYGLSAMLTLIIYSIGENVLFNQGVVISLVVWIIFFSCVYTIDINKNMNKLNYIKQYSKYTDTDER